jgi:hypothetical protein
MRFLRQLGIVAALLVQSLPMFADDVITNVMSPVVSYQYQDDFSGSGVVSPIVSYPYFNALGESGTTLISPVVSYQYFDWPGDGVLQLSSSPRVSYLFYSYLGPTPALPTAFPTASLPPTSMVARPRVPSGTQFLVYANGAFATDVPLDANKMCRATRSECHLSSRLLERGRRNT